MKLSIRILSGTRAGQVEELHSPGGSLGREADNLVCIPDGTVSARHAYFSSDGENWWVRDLRSTNKTRLDGVALDETAVLLGTSGRLQFGRVDTAYSVDSDKTASPQLGELRTLVLHPSAGVDSPQSGGQRPVAPADDQLLPLTISRPAQPRPAAPSTPELRPYLDKGAPPARRITNKLEQLRGESLSQDERAECLRQLNGLAEALQQAMAALGPRPEELAVARQRLNELYARIENLGLLLEPQSERS